MLAAPLPVSNRFRRAIGRVVRPIRTVGRSVRGWSAAMLVAMGSAAAPAATGAAFADLKPWWDEFTGGQRSGLIVWHRGEIVAEWYGGGFGAEALFEIGSLRKSFNSALIGVKGIDVQTRAYDVWPEIFTHTGREKDKAITLHQLVSATSGWKTERGPGEEFLYNNAAFTAAERVVARLLRLPRDEIAPEVERLFKAPLGATSWRVYHWDRPFNPADRSTGPKLSIDSTVRDLLKWGVLWHNRGQHEGRQLIPAAWVARATGIVNPHLPGPHYGYNWFVNADGALWPGLPRDAFGHSGSGTFRDDGAKSRAFVFVCPSLQLVAASVVAKEGHPEDFFEARSASAREFFGRLVRAAGVTASNPEEASFYFPPPGESLDQQRQISPAEAGFKPDVIRSLQGVATRWALWRRGRLVHVEGGFNDRVEVASLRKTWFAVAVGAALQQGKIPSLEQPLSIWETDLAGKHARATWRHVLIQASGFDYPYGPHPAYAPGEMWTYSDLNARRVTNALAKVYGRRGMYDDFGAVLVAAYFDAIGLQGWQAAKKETQDDGPRLWLDLEDMGRLGLLVLARGRWADRQIVPAAFIAQLETKQTAGMKVNYDGPNDGRPTSLHGQEARYPEAPYGFLTWTNSDGAMHPQADRGWAWGSGKGGHIVLWNARLGIVFAAHGRDRNVALPELLEANLAHSPVAAR